MCKGIWVLHAFSKPWCKKELLFDHAKCLIIGRKYKILVVQTYKLVCIY